MSLTWGDDAPDHPPDPGLPVFSGAEADRFRHLVGEVFARHGVPVTVHPGHVVDGYGRRFGLTNVAAVCHAEARRERGWRRRVDRHVRLVLAAVGAPSPFDTMPLEEIRSATFLRLKSTAEAASVGLAYAREVAPGLSEVLDLELPDVVVTYRDEQVERCGPLEELRALGLANLRGVDAGEHVEMWVDGVVVHLLSGRSVFTASLALALDDLVATYDPPLGAAGVLVCVPNRHELSFHVVRDREATSGALDRMAYAARMAHSAGVGAVSPDVYWWRDGRLTRVVESGPDGPVTRLGPELSGLLDDLA